MLTLYGVGERVHVLSGNPVKIHVAIKVSGFLSIRDVVTVEC